MKRISMLLLVLCTSMLVFAQKSTTIQGVVKNGSSRQVSLYVTEGGRALEIAMVAMAKDSSYQISFVPEKAGFYMVGNSDRKYVIYVKGGESVNIDLSPERAELNGPNTKENKALYEWENFIDTLRYESMIVKGIEKNYTKFLTLLPESLKKADSMKKNVKSGNKEFDELLKKKVSYDVDYYAINFIMDCWSAPARESWPPFFNTVVSDSKFASEDVLLFPTGLEQLSLYANFTKYIKAPVQDMMAIHNDRLRGELLLFRMEEIQYQSAFDRKMEELGKYLVTESQTKRAQALCMKLIQDVGQRPTNFVYPDVNGKDVALKNIKGKVILIDIWACWCEPCKKEMPFLKKLEKEFEGQDIVFMGISLDMPDGKQRWLKFVEKNELGGVQLFAYGQMPQSYNINAVPRFILIGKDGKFITADAPRPSDPRLKRMIEEALKK